MVAWLLSPDNTAFAKSALRAELPSVKSSHLAEAFAASLGLRTYAALLARQKGANRLRPPLLHADNVLFAKRLAELGYAMPERDIIAELAHHPCMPIPCWREFPRRNIDANNSWYYQCKRLGLPNVCVHVGTKYRRLWWDCISVSPREDRHVRDQRGDLVCAMYEEFQSTVGPASGKPLFFGSAFAGSITSLLPSVARTLADRLFEQLYVPLLDPAQSHVEDWL